MNSLSSKMENYGITTRKAGYADSLKFQDVGVKRGATPPTAVTMYRVPYTKAEQ
jgi:hypothetical protein